MTLFRRPWLLATALLLALFLLYLWLKPDTPLQVQTDSVSRGSVEAMVANTRSGTLKACQRSRLSPPMGGVVDRLLVDEGDHVEAGQLLLALWNADLRASHERALAAFDAAERNRDQSCLSADQAERESQRLRSLVKRQLVSVESAENADTAARTARLACEASRAQARVAKAERDLTGEQLEKTLLKAPFAGVVAEINGEPGEYITPSPPGILTPPAVDLIDDSCLYVTAPIDEIDAARVSIGQTARITLDAFGNRSFTGRVARIAPYVTELEKQARTVDVDVHFEPVPDNITLLVGYSADVEIVLDSRESVLRIPSAALLEERFVLVPDSQGILQKRELNTGLANWHHTEVLAGLQEGEAVVTSLGQPGVQAGTRIALP